MSSRVSEVVTSILDSYFSSAIVSTFGLSIKPVNERAISPYGFFLLSSDELELLDFLDKTVKLYFWS
jgi:hypothetical protein